MRYNRNRIVRALALFDDLTRPLFHCLPFLIHVNHPALPGYVNDAKLPYGLQHYSFSPKVRLALAQLLPQFTTITNKAKLLKPKHCAIESLSLMGSIGTAAQSAKSDLDYWVCVDGQQVKGKKWRLLQQKLNLIERWAWDHYHLEVHFFLSDIKKIRNNDFGEADGESAGSAQPLFLKNEYYSTHIMLAGKIPFWWITPAGCTDDEYQQAYTELKATKSLDPDYFIDLGNISRLNANELFGASLWQLTKAMDSPFKSVLKMAKLEVFTHDTNQSMPLCNVLKDRIHKSKKLDRNVKNTDPYALMFDTIINYYQLKNPQFLELFKTCLYIKSDCALTQPPAGGKSHFKRDILTDYVQSWSWKPDKLAHLDNIKHWQFMQVSKLGRVIHSFLIGCYRRLSSQIKGCEQLVSAQDMTVIGRKIESFYRVKPGKITYLKRAFDEGLIQSELTITKDLDLSFATKQRWSAFRGRQHYQNTQKQNACLLNQSCDPVGLILWCQFNRIINQHSQFYLLQNNLTICVQDIDELINDALVDYQPIRISELSRKQLLAPSQITHCLLVINFTSRSSAYEIETVRVVYLTSWGELFSFEKLQTFEKIKATFASQAQQPICRLFTPARNNREKLYTRVEQITDMRFERIGSLNLEDPFAVT
jgi:adenylate cyclase class 1